MGQHAGAAGGVAASCRDRETDAAGAFQYNTAGVKCDFQQHATQHINAVKAKYSRSGQ